MPFTLRCEKCGWSKTISPHSDALFVGQIPDKCPACGNSHLTKSQSQIGVGSLINSLERLFTNKA
jgi:phage FluMu protein Com